MEADLEGFDPVELEKVGKLFEILDAISDVRYLRERLSFYGGTCLNFAYFEGIPRLSVDLDFNYRNRHASPWEEDWETIDEKFKRIFSDLGYDMDPDEGDLVIDPSDPKKGLILSYERESGGFGQIEIEIGYLRRIPLFRDDDRVDVLNPFNGRTIEIMAPIKEELFANKFCTMLYRGDRANPRDIFDVYTISGLDFDVDRFRSLAILDSLTRPEPKHPRLHEVDPREFLSDAPIDDRLRNLLRDRQPPDDLLERVTGFTTRIVDSLTTTEVEVIDAFHDTGEMEFEQLEYSSQFHPQITQHPNLLWSLREMGHVEDPSSDV